MRRSTAARFGARADNSARSWSISAMVGTYQPRFTFFTRTVISTSTRNAAVSAGLVPQRSHMLTCIGHANHYPGGALSIGLQSRVSVAVPGPLLDKESVLNHAECRPRHCIQLPEVLEKARLHHQQRRQSPNHPHLRMSRTRALAACARRAWLPSGAAARELVDILMALSRATAPLCAAAERNVELFKTGRSRQDAVPVPDSGGS